MPSGQSPARHLPAPEQVLTWCPAQGRSLGEPWLTSWLHNWRTEGIGPPGWGHTLLMRSGQNLPGPHPAQGKL